MKPNHTRTLLTAALLLGGILTVARAADVTATLTNSGNWNDPTRWSSNPLFPSNGNGGFTYDVVQSNHTITVNQAITIEKYTFSVGTNTGAGFTLTLNDLFTWSSGTMNGSGTTNVLDSAILDTTNSKQMNGAMILNFGDGVGAAGSVTAGWTGGTLDLRNGGAMNIKADAAFTTNFDGLISNFGGGTGIINIESGGSFTKNGGTLTTSIGTANPFAFNNSGTVNVNTGTLLIGAGSNGGTHTGAFNVSGGAVLNLAGAHTLNGGSTSFSGAGTTTFSGTITAGAATSIGSAWSLTGTLTGTGAVGVTGAAIWSSGFMSGTGTTNILNSITFDTGSTKQVTGGRILNIGDGIGAAGSVTAGWTGGTLDIRSGGTMNIKADAAFTTNFDGVINNGAGAAGVINIESGGSFTKNGGTLTTSIGTNGNPFTLNNQGGVNVSSGTLALNNITLTQHSGTTLTGGAWNVSNGAAITRTAGSNITTIGANASVTLDGAGSSFAKVTDALATNQGSFTLKNNRDLTTVGAYANSGTTRVEDSTTVMTIGAGGASAYTQTGLSSVTILADGAMIDTSAFNLNGGSLQGTGTIDGPLSATTANATTIAPGASPGTLTINGSTVLGANNTLAMEIGGLGQGVDYDYLDVNGVLTLAGLLDIDFINLFENSVLPSDIFTIATANSPILGAFSNVASGDRIGTNTIYTFEVWYGAGSPFGASNLVLTGAPEPSRGLFLLIAATAAIFRRRRVA